MNMKTNVFFKSGLNLVCDEVHVYSVTAFLYKHNLTPSLRVELMNACLSNDWEFSEQGEGSLKIRVSRDSIEQFKAVL